MGFSGRFLGGIILILLLQSGTGRLMAMDETAALLTDAAPGTEMVMPKAGAHLFEASSLDQGISKQRFKNLEIQIYNNSRKTLVHPRTIAITILGPPFDPGRAAALENEIAAYINVAGFSPGFYVRPAKVLLPKGYVLVDANPELFVVEIKGGR